MGRLVKNPDLVANAGSATGSGQISAGTTAQRPSNTDEAHIRYNLTTSALEYWSGAAWTQVGKTGLTTVVVDSLTGANGVKVLFQSGDGVSQSIAAATDVLIFIGGVYQIPTTNYTVSGTDITFTSPPPNLESITVVHNLNQVT
jgi:hypothetical protein